MSDDEYDETKDLDLGSQADYFQAVADAQDSNRTVDKYKERIRELEQKLTGAIRGAYLYDVIREILIVHGCSSDSDCVHVPSLVSQWIKKRDEELAEARRTIDKQELSVLAKEAIAEMATEKLKEVKQERDSLRAEVERLRQGGER